MRKRKKGNEGERTVLSGKIASVMGKASLCLSDNQLGVGRAQRRPCFDSKRQSGGTDKEKKA